MTNKEAKLQMLDRFTTIYSSSAIASLIGSATVFAKSNERIFLGVLGAFLLIVFVISLMAFVVNISRMREFIQKTKLP